MTKEACHFSNPSQQRYEFAAPRILETDDYLLPLNLLRNGFSVEIPPIPNSVAGDRGSLNVWGKYGFFGQPFVITDPLQPTIVRCAPENTAGVAGPGGVQYLFFGNPAGNSEPRYCEFQEAFPTPQIKDYESNREDSYLIPGETADSGISIVIPPLRKHGNR